MNIDWSDPRSYEHYWNSTWNKATCIAEVMGSNPVRAWIFFQALFQLLV